MAVTKPDALPSSTAVKVVVSVLGTIYVAGQFIVCVWVTLFDDRPTRLGAVAAILFLPVLAWIVCLSLVLSLPRRRWLSLIIAAPLIASPWWLFQYRFQPYWPVAGAAQVNSAHCPKPWVVMNGSTTEAQFPDYRDRVTYPVYAGAAGGIPASFTPVTVTRCLLTSINQHAHTATVTEQTVNGRIGSLVSALRRPAEVWRGRCTAVSFWAPTPPPNYLIMTDAHGQSYIVGLPTNGCGTPHPDAIAAFDALPWKTTAVTTTT